MTGKSGDGGPVCGSEGTVGPGESVGVPDGSEGPVAGVQVREQYAAVIQRAWLDSNGDVSASDLADAVIAVADAEQTELKKALAFADEEYQAQGRYLEDAAEENARLRVDHLENVRLLAEIRDTVQRLRGELAQAVAEREQAEADLDHRDEQIRHLGNGLEHERSANARMRSAAALHRQGLLSTTELHAVIGPAVHTLAPAECECTCHHTPALADTTKEDR